MSEFQDYINIPEDAGKMQTYQATLTATMETDLELLVDIEVPADWDEQQILEAVSEAQHDYDGDGWGSNYSEPEGINGGWRRQDPSVEPTVKRYEVLHTMVLGEPENIWQEGTERQTFASKAEAQAAIDEHIKDVEEAVARGDMTESDETDLETYIISEVKV